MTIELVSFDWDYCVPVAERNKWGHEESMFLLTEVWNTREVAIVKKKDCLEDYEILDIGSLLPEVNFPRVNVPFRFGIGESHTQALEHFMYSIEMALEKGQAIDKMDWVIHHYDLHHDIWKITEQITAENWLHHFIQWLRRKFNNIKITVKWHTPYWFEEQGYNVEAYGWSQYKDWAEKIYDVKMEHIQDGKDLDNMMPVSVFLCRSGCWTPPHLDPYFKTLCIDIMNLIGEESNLSNLLPVRVYRAYNNTVDPMISRPFTYPALNSTEQMKLPTGNDKDFPDAMVRQMAIDHLVDIGEKKEEEE